MSELQPDTREVLQEEPEYVMAVQGCVTVKGPVRTQSLPRKGGATRTRVATDTKAVQVVEADHRRWSVTLMSNDEPMYVGYGKASIEDTSTMSLWPVNVPFVCGATVDVYVLCATAGETTRVSATGELWAEG